MAARAEAANGEQSRFTASAAPSAIPDISNRAALQALLLVIAAGAVLRGVGLESGLWHDEIATLVRYARRPVADIVSTYDSQNQHPLYSLLAHASIVLFGESAWSARLPAAVFGVASVGAAYWFATLVTSRLEALVAAALLAASYHHVWFSQNARGYTLLLFLTLIASGILLRLLSGRARKGGLDVAAYAVVMALAVYTHLSAGFVVAAHGIVWAWWALAARRSGRQSGVVRGLVALVLAGALSLLLYANVLPQLLHTLFGPKPGPMVEAVWRSPLWLLAETARGLSRGLPGGWLAMGIAALIAGAGAWSYLRRDPIAFGIMVLPPVTVAVVMVALGHNLWPRLFFFAAAFAVLVVVRGVYTLAEILVGRRGRLLATVAMSVVIAGSAVTVPRAWGPKQDFGAALAYVQQHRQAGEAAVVLGLSDLALLEYLEAGWPAPKTGADLMRIEAAHPRTWAIFTFPTHLAALYPDVSERLRHYRVAAEFPGTVGGGAVYVMVNR